MSDSTDSIHLFRLMFGRSLSMGINAVAELRIPDLLARGSMPVEELAILTNTHAPALVRLLRALASHGVFVEKGSSVFENNSASSLLRTDVEGSLWGEAIFMNSKASWDSWRAFQHTLSTGRAAYEHVTNEKGPEAYSRHKAKHNITPVTNFERTMAFAIAEVFDFSEFEKIVTFGGGGMMLMSRVLQQYPETTALVVESSRRTEFSKKYLDSLDLSDRCDVQIGDFSIFETASVSGDAVVIFGLLHEYPDDVQAKEVLSICREHMEQNAHLLCMEPVLCPGQERDIAKLLDLEMLTLMQGVERTEEDLARILQATGFTLRSITPSGTFYSVIDATIAGATHD